MPDYRLEPPDRFDDLNQFDPRDVEEQSGTFDPRDGVVVCEDEDRAFKRVENTLDRWLSEGLKAHHSADLQRMQRLIQLIEIRAQQHEALLAERRNEMERDDRRVVNF